MNYLNMYRYFQETIFKLFSKIDLNLSKLLTNMLSILIVFTGKQQSNHFKFRGIISC